MTDVPPSAPQPPPPALPGLERAYLLPRDVVAAGRLLGTVPRWQEPGSLSVGAVVKVLNQGEGLLYWANKVGLEGKTLDEARTSSRSGGSKAHTAFTALAEGGTPEGSGGIIKWYHVEQVVLLDCERWMVSRDLPRVHGKADYVRLAGTDPRGLGQAVVVGDAKPLGNGRTFFEQHVQVAGYAYVLEQAGVAVAGTEILLYDDVDYRVVPGVVPTAFFGSLARMALRVNEFKALI